jgi:two-component system cell cycle sensor histidine kinase/response regulator CckA
VADRPARILIVDDERLDRQVLEVMLTSEGFELVTAASGEEALALVAQQPPDLILLDVVMPDTDGYQVAVKIKGDPATRNIPIIMITTLDDHDAKMLGLSAGAEDFLTKPVDRAELCVRVRNLLRLKAHGDYYDKQSHALEAEVLMRTADVRQEREALRVTEERMRFAMEAAGVGMWDMDYTTGVHTWSKTLEAQYGLQPGTFGGTFEAFIDRVHPEDREVLLETVGKAVKAGGDFSVQNRTIWPDGTVRWLNGSGRVLLGADNEPLRAIGVSQDITERRRLEQQAQQAQKMEAVGRLASGVAHDFNNLLSVILGCAEMMRTDVAMPKGHEEDLTEIMQAARRAAGLTKQLLAFGRQQVMHAVALDVNGLIQDMTGMFDRLLGDNVDVALALAPNLGAALADRGQLEQVVMNLVVNARDAMPGGGRVTIQTADVELETSMFHDEATLPGDYVMIAVTDTGSGMSKDTQRRLFEPFFTTKEPGNGTGLGLSTSYGIVKQSKGYIWVYSELGQGTTFKVYLPRAAAAIPVPAVRAEAGAPLPRASETVLLVEDEAGVRRVSKRILDKAGFRVFEAANSEEAEALYARHGNAIDLLVTDVSMPGGGGPELVGRLQSHAPGLRVLYMSGNAEHAVHPAKVDRHLPFVQKPFTGAELVRQVREALGGPVAPN